MTAASPQEKVKQVYIKSKCGLTILLHTVTVKCWTQLYSKLKTVIAAPLYFGPLFYYFKSLGPYSRKIPATILLEYIKWCYYILLVLKCPWLENIIPSRLQHDYNVVLTGIFVPI